MDGPLEHLIVSMNRPSSLMSPPALPPPMEASGNRLLGKLSTLPLAQTLSPPMQAPGSLLPATPPETLPVYDNSPPINTTVDYDDSSPDLFTVPSWFLSMVVHMAVVTIAALIPILQPPPRVESLRLSVTLTEDPIDVDEVSLEVDIALEDIESVFDEIENETLLDPPHQDDKTAQEMVDEMFSRERRENSLFSRPAVAGVPNGALAGDELAGRGPSRRALLVRTGGGNAASERAVTLALAWLAEHQSSDGGWSFDHAHSPQCQGRCGNPGSARQARMGATAMALLPFLGAGHTHQQGEYQDVVQRGLRYLVGEQKSTGSLFDLNGRMYSHGLAAVTLCEAYGMTRDHWLQGPAQTSLDFIVDAQHPAGGWRYSPGQAGDTSIVGWQIMALKSGYLAYLEVPKETIERADKFLDSVQSGDYGSFYGYTNRGKSGPATTSIGLLCRMYLGWKKEHLGLRGGIDYLSQTGPSSSNMYYNYYATQVMHHFGGKPWEKWNTVMRDQLVESQAQTGHATGSWFMPDRHVRSGGRLYCTSMAAMILEVYYRHLPIYQPDATEKEFSDN